LASASDKIASSPINLKSERSKCVSGSAVIHRWKAIQKFWLVRGLYIFVFKTSSGPIGDFIWRYLLLVARRSWDGGYDSEIWGPEALLALKQAANNRTTADIRSRHEKWICKI
jgi:hypothetical protein